MKTAIYVEDGTIQLVITPQSEFEKNALKTFEGKQLAAKIMVASFYEAQGGYFRQGAWGGIGDYGREDRSLILRVDTKEGEPKP